LCSSKIVISNAISDTSITRSWGAPHKTKNKRKIGAHIEKW